MVTVPALFALVIISGGTFWHPQIHATTLLTNLSHSQCLNARNEWNIAHPLSAQSLCLGPEKD